MGEHGINLPIIAKIERAEAVGLLDVILLEQADRVMIAGGDLSAEMESEAVPVLQMVIIIEDNRRRRLVMIASQMLESMTRATRPRRAEASDVANTIFDGTDAAMFSAEPVVGLHSIERVLGINETTIRQYVRLQGEQEAGQAQLEL